MKIRTSTKQQQNNIIPFPSFITNKTEQKWNGNKTHHTHTQTYSLRRRMADPGKDKNREKRKREHKKWRFGPQQNNNKITSYPSLLLLQPKNWNRNKTHTNTQTYSLRGGMADPGRDKTREKRKRGHRKWRFGPQQNNNKITSYPSRLLLQTRPNKKKMEIKHTHAHTHQLTGCAEEWRIPLKTRTEKREKENIEN
jgi:hypothetical protein